MIFQVGTLNNFCGWLFFLVIYSLDLTGFLDYDKQSWGYPFATLGWWYAHGVIVSTAVSESSHFGRPSGQCPKTLRPGKVTIWLFKRCYGEGKTSFQSSIDGPWLS